jgi:hypothetical protein
MGGGDAPAADNEIARPILHPSGPDGPYHPDGREHSLPLLTGNCKRFLGCFIYVRHPFAAFARNRLGRIKGFSVLNKMQGITHLVEQCPASSLPLRARPVVVTIIGGSLFHRLQDRIISCGVPTLVGSTKRPFQ